MLMLTAIMVVWMVKYSLRFSMGFSSLFQETLCNVSFLLPKLNDPTEITTGQFSYSLSSPKMYLTSNPNFFTTLPFRSLCCNSASLTGDYSQFLIP